MSRSEATGYACAVAATLVNNISSRFPVYPLSSSSLSPPSCPFPRPSPSSTPSGFSKLLRCTGEHAVPPPPLRHICRRHTIYRTPNRQHHRHRIPGHPLEPIIRRSSWHLAHGSYPPRPGRLRIHCTGHHCHTAERVHATAHNALVLPVCATIPCTRHLRAPTLEHADSQRRVALQLHRATPPLWRRRLWVWTKGHLCKGFLDSRCTDHTGFGM